MTERAPILSDNFLGGIEWDKFQRPKAVVDQIRHGSDGISCVDVTFEEKRYRIALDTSDLDLDEAEIACRNVPEWWEASKHHGGLYSVLDEDLQSSS
jgi:hypothetical protein